MTNQEFPAYKEASVADLVPYARNARTHSAEQVDKIAASIREFGFLNPVITDGEDGIVAGHGRIMAAQKLGMEQVPVVEASHLTDAQKRAYIIADNRLALDAGWDDEILKVEFDALAEDGFDLELTGFTLDEIEALEPKTEGETDEDETPEAQSWSIAETGDTWLLGRHRVRCGDSTSADDVTALLNGVEPHLMVTDPPYGVNYDAEKARASSSDSAKGKVANDDNADWREAWALFPGDVAYVWHAGLHAKEVVQSLESCNFHMRAQIIWDKQRPIMSRGAYHFQHEPCWYAVRKNGTGHWNGDRKQSTVWQIDHRKSETGHSTQKPVECMRRPIVNNSAPGQPVYDPFLGSGTTLMAGETENRPVYGMELSPEYVDVIIKRWQDFTGKQATHEETGKTFAEMEADRVPQST